MDIEEFYDEDPRRRSSEELEFGRDWSDSGIASPCEVWWVADTGEVYAMLEPYSRRGVETEMLTVEILGVVRGRDALERVMEGWQDAMSEPNSLAWLRARVAGGEPNGFEGVTGPAR